MSSCPVDHGKSSNEINNRAENVCPVDNEARQEWLKIHSKNNNSVTTEKGCDSSLIESKKEICPHLNSNTHSLENEREVSSIPKYGSNGNWMYPSQEMFFNAMKRKNHNPHAEDMKTVVPIHNAVNERAWYEILKWEKGYLSDDCPSPKLVSFSGDSKKRTPRAILNTLFGYQSPFDRHDWVIDRCGKKIEYVIDFYATNSPASDSFSNPSFFLDVRPKLNSFQGFYMRIRKFLEL